MSRFVPSVPLVPMDHDFHDLARVGDQIEIVVHAKSLGLYPTVPGAQKRLSLTFLTVARMFTVKRHPPIFQLHPSENTLFPDTIGYRGRLIALECDFVR